MAVYHIGDLHLGHRSICKYRTQFSSVEEHDEFIVDSILSVLHKRDKLIIHGDLGFNKESLHHIKRITDRVDVAELILGNHDLESGTRPTLMELMPLFNGKIYSMVKYKGTWLTHAPIHPDELRGCVNIHGHVHGNSILGDNRYLNVSCEAIDYKPIEHIKLMQKHGHRI